MLTTCLCQDGQQIIDCKSGRAKSKVMRMQRIPAQLRRTTLHLTVHKHEVEAAFQNKIGEGFCAI